MRHISSFVETSHAPASTSLFARLRTAARTVWQNYLHRRRLKATIQSLGALDDRTLKDIGLSRTEIESVVMTEGRDRKQGLDAGLSIFVSRG